MEKQKRTLKEESIPRPPRQRVSPVEGGREEKNNTDAMSLDTDTNIYALHCLHAFRAVICEHLVRSWLRIANMLRMMSDSSLYYFMFTFVRLEKHHNTRLTTTDPFVAIKRISGYPISQRR